MANPDRSVYDPPFDDDLVFDTVDEQDTSRGRPLMILLGIIVLLAFAGVVWVAYRQGVEHAARSEPPLLAQDPGPTRVAAPADQGPAVPNNPIYDEIGGSPAATNPATETLAPAAEEPAALPPSTATAEPPPAPSAAEPAPDTTVGQIPTSGSTRTASAPPAIPNEIAGPSAAVDPLAPGASLPPAVDLPPAASEVAPPAPAKPTPAELAATKAEKDRLAKEAATKKAEAARLAEVKRQQQLAAGQPASALPPVTTPPATAPEPAAPVTTPPDFVDDTTTALPRDFAAAPPATGPRPDASGRPTLLTPPSIDLPAPGFAPASAAQPAAPTPSATTPPTRSAVVPDETPAPAASPPAGSGSYVVQIGAFNSAEDAAASWKRMESSFASALAGASPEIRQTEINGKTKYRLRATGYADKSAANSACSRLKAAGQGCFVAGR